MASERAKELAAKQKAELKAAKLAKKNSNDPKDWGWFKQITQTVKMTVEVDPSARWKLIGALVVVWALVAVVGGVLQPRMWWLWLIFGLVTGVLAALYLLVWLAKRGTYKRFAGKPGSAEVALSMLNKKAWTHSGVITANRQFDAVHRAVGRPGIVLIGEGSAARVKSMLQSEAKKHEQVALGVPVTTIMMGDQDGQVPLEKLAKHLNHLPKAIRVSQVAEVNQRLKALDAVRPRVPAPKGPLVAPKGAAKALRGR
ncbi:MAG: DUF4191 domain-containing protein [Propionibacteriaceae bacterium]|jgi:hypothetical protein|nr:DUF4191 domain-containing protein [Propionibacteriaceae bacterium]